MYFLPSRLNTKAHKQQPLARWLLLVIYNVYFHPLSKFPGPKHMAASRIPYALHLKKGTLNEAIHQAHKKYGEVVRIAPDELSFTSGETAWQDIYGFRTAKQDKGSYMKDHLFYNIPPNGVPSINTPISDREHSRHRRILAHAFSDKALREQESLIQQHVNLLIFRLKEQCEGPDHGRVYDSSSHTPLCWRDFAASLTYIIPTATWSIGLNTPLSMS